MGWFKKSEGGDEHGSSKINSRKDHHHQSPSQQQVTKSQTQETITQLQSRQAAPSPVKAVDLSSRTARASAALALSHHVLIDSYGNVRFDPKLWFASDLTKYPPRPRPTKLYKKDIMDDSLKGTAIVSYLKRHFDEHENVQPWEHHEGDGSEVHSFAHWRSLQLHSLNLGDDGAMALGDYTKHPYSMIRELYLQCNGIGARGAAILSEALLYPSTVLVVLNLNNNDLGDKGASFLMRSLFTTTCRLEVLALGKNHLGDAGAIHIAHGLKSPDNRLRDLDLYGNDIGNRGAEALRKAILGDHAKLESINLSVNAIGEKMQAKLRKAEEILHSEHRPIEINLLNQTRGVPEEEEEEHTTPKKKWNLIFQR